MIEVDALRETRGALSSWIAETQISIRVRAEAVAGSAV